MEEPGLLEATLTTFTEPPGLAVIGGFDSPQVIAFFTVSANIRMLVVRLSNGKLWVCGPIAPTKEPWDSC